MGPTASFPNDDLRPFRRRAEVTRASMAAALLLAAACGGGEKRAPGSDTAAPAAGSGSSGVALTGAGATFPQPIYSKWFSTYAAKTGVKINYQSIGSGGGI